MHCDIKSISFTKLFTFTTYFKKSIKILTIIWEKFSETKWDINAIQLLLGKLWFAIFWLIFRNDWQLSQSSQQWYKKIFYFKIIY
jgi:hypothetical protein